MPALALLSSRSVCVALKVLLQTNNSRNPKGLGLPWQIARNPLACALLEDDHSKDDIQTDEARTCPQTQSPSTFRSDRILQLAHPMP